ncbi:MAG: DUF881 domain-containing protein [Actinomycetes bacterium]
MSQESPAAEPSPDTNVGWRRLRNVLFAKPSRDQLVIAVLCAVLGFAVVQQVSIVNSDEVLATARSEDLVQILDSLDQRNQRLDAELATLKDTKASLESGQDAAATAAKERQVRDAELGILAGTLAAQGPGVVVTMTGPVTSSLLLDAVQELRDAGAEAIQINQVRVVAQTAFEAGANAEVVVGGVAIGKSTGTYRITAIGDSATLASSLKIPGGVVESAKTDGVTVVIVEKSEVKVSAVLPVKKAD